MYLKGIKIKNDNEAGLLYAYDSENNYVPATEAKPHIPYSCPYCGIRMHPTTTRSGRRIYAKNPGQVHCNPACLTIEAKGVEHTFDGVNPNKLFVSLCYATPRKKDDKGKKDAETPPSSSSTDTKLSDTCGTPVPFSSLKQIAESGIEILNSDDKQGDYKVSDYLMTYKYAKKFFTNPNFTLGGRIVYARFSFSDYKLSSLVFSLYSGTDFCVKFRVIFTSRRDFVTYRGKFEEYIEDENGRTKFRKRYKKQDVLLVSDDWRRIDKIRCNDCCFFKNCNSCWGMYQVSFTNSKQLYLIPNDY